MDFEQHATEKCGPSRDGRSEIPGVDVVNCDVNTGGGGEPDLNAGGENLAQVVGESDRESLRSVSDRGADCFGGGDVGDFKSELLPNKADGDLRLSRGFPGLDVDSKVNIVRVVRVGVEGNGEHVRCFGGGRFKEAEVAANLGGEVVASGDYEEGEAVSLWGSVIGPDDELDGGGEVGCVPERDGFGVEDSPGAPLLRDVQVVGFGEAEDGGLARVVGVDLVD
ncbi:hypothetical protein SASPL_131864 [Salvia splendens]|nr:hypothetical protein SASPL_131860 [Salvia splendens]KAG6408837.1 hypothetical protein SASPL_131862 [Salvia splendens]KAG6408839.1 hypothetical protein SASPL_131864 [Salvia splendens]